MTIFVTPTGQYSPYPRRIHNGYPIQTYPTKRQHSSICLTTGKFELWKASPSIDQQGELKNTHLNGKQNVPASPQCMDTATRSIYRSATSVEAERTINNGTFSPPLNVLWLFGATPQRILSELEHLIVLQHLRTEVAQAALYFQHRPFDITGLQVRDEEFER